MTKDDWKRITDALKAPFAPEQVSWRVQRNQGNQAQVLAFIDARNVMDRLDEVCGSENWVYDWDPIVVEGGQVKVAKGKLSLFGLPPKCDIGDAGSIEVSKSAISDALKRAAVHWGVGRYLYELEAETVTLTNGKIGAQELKRLQSLLPGSEEQPPAVVDLKTRADDLGIRGDAWKATVCQATEKSDEEAKKGLTVADRWAVKKRLDLIEKSGQRVDAQKASA